jgi:hypothetical protein
VYQILFSGVNIEFRKVYLEIPLFWAVYIVWRTLNAKGVFYMKKMEKKIFLMGILAIALVFGMTVIGCEDGVQLVAFERADAVEGVWAEYVASYTMDRVFVSWGKHIKNAVSYDVYLKTDEFGMHHLSSVSGLMGVTSFSREELLNLEKSDYETTKMSFGVTVTYIDKNLVPSNIVWSEYINIPNSGGGYSPIVGGNIDG